MKIKISHFKCYNKEEFILKPGMTLFDGQSGCGKSSILEAIHYCLFGQDAKYVVQHGRQSEGAQVELWYKHMYIVRNVAKKILTVKNEENGMLLKNEEAQHYIHQYMNMNGCSKYIYFIQQMSDTALLLQTSSEKVKLLETWIFEDSKLKHMKEEAKKLEHEYQRVITSLDKDIHGLQSVIDTLQKRIILDDINDVDLNSIQTTIVDKKKQIHVLTKKIKKSRDEHDNYHTCYYEWKKNIDMCQNRLKKVNEELRHMRAKKEELGMYSKIDYDDKYERVSILNKYIEWMRYEKKIRATIHTERQKYDKQHILTDEKIVEYKERVSILNKVEYIHQIFVKFINKLQACMNTFTEELYITFKDIIELLEKGDINQLLSIKEGLMAYMNDIVISARIQKKSKCPSCQFTFYIMKNYTIETLHQQVNNIDEENMNEANRIDEVLGISIINILNEMWTILECDDVKCISDIGDIELLLKNKMYLSEKKNIESKLELHTIWSNKHNPYDEAHPVNVEIKEVRNSIENYRLRYTWISDEPELLKNMYEKEMNDILCKLNELRWITQSYDTLLREQDKLEQDYSSYNAHVYDKCILDNMKINMDTLMKNEKELTKEIHDLIYTYNEQVRMKNIHNDIKVSMKKLNNLNEQKRKSIQKLTCIDVLKKSLVKAELSVLKDSIHQLNETAAYYINRFFPEDSTISIRLEFDDKHGIQTVCMMNGQERLLKTCSAGEKQRLCLAYQLACISCFCKQVPFIMIDEALNNLDSETLNTVMNTLRTSDLMNLDTYILVISHQSVHGLFDNVIYV